MKRYRGPRYSKRQGLMIFGLLALLLILITAGAYFLLRDAIVFTPDGLRFTFNQDKEPTPPVNPDPEPEIIIEPPTTPVEPEVPVEPETPVSDFTAQGIVLSPQKLLDSAYLDSLIALCKTKAYTAVTVIIKDESGIVNVPYSGKYLSKDGVLPESAAVAQALEKLKLAGINTVALISACRDNLGAHSFREGSAGTGRSLWLDKKYIAWFDPYKPQVAEYLKELTTVCIDLGFSEIIFDNFNFANNGKTEMLNYGEQALDKSSAIAALAEQLQAYADGKIVLSAVLTATATTALTDAAAGQDVALLSKHFDRLYAPSKDFAFDLTAINGALAGGCSASLWVSGALPLPDTSAVKAGFMLKTGDYIYK